MALQLRTAGLHAARLAVATALAVVPITSLSEPVETHPFGPYGDSSDPTILWMLAGPLLAILVIFTLMFLLLLLPSSAVEAKLVESGQLPDKVTAAWLLFACCIAWAVLGVFWGPVGLSLLWSIFATLGTLCVAVVGLALGVGFLLETLAVRKKRRISAAAALPRRNDAISGLEPTTPELNQRD